MSQIENKCKKCSKILSRSDVFYEGKDFLKAKCRACGCISSIKPSSLKPKTIRSASCPKCKSSKIVKDGIYSKTNTQQYKCKACGLRYSSLKQRGKKVIPKVKFVELVIAKGFKDPAAIAEQLKISEKTIRKYFLEMGRVQRARYSYKGKTKVFVQVEIKKKNKKVTFEITLDEKEFINGCEITSNIISQNNDLRIFMKKEGFLYRVEMSNSIDAAQRKMDAFIHIWNTARSMQTGYFPIPNDSVEPDPYEIKISKKYSLNLVF